jgi:tetratricopeptide (TPR) repeat protein
MRLPLRCLRRAPPLAPLLRRALSSSFGLNSPYSPSPFDPVRPPAPDPVPASRPANGGRVVTDFTGAELSASLPSTRFLVDTSIMQIVTRNDDATAMLTEATFKDPDCGLCWAMLGFEYFRNTTPDLKTGHVMKCLERLNDLSKQGKLNAREASMGAALLAYVEGRYSTAAACLEGVLEENEMDVLAMRLAQDCHVSAGDSAGALRCVSSRMHLYHDNHPLHGHVLGMLAMGYLENGMHLEAEELGTQATFSTNGTDTNAVQAVLAAIHMSYKSMNLSRQILDYAANNPGPGRHPFSFLEGNYQLHQGNFNGALESFDLLMERISDPSTRFLSSLVYATMLLLQIDLQVRAVLCCAVLC